MIWFAIPVAFLAGATWHAYRDQATWWLGFLYHKARGHHR